MAGQKKTTAKPLKLDKKLILNQWMLELFEAPSFQMLAEGLKNPELEGFDADNISLFHHVLKAQLFNELSFQRICCLRMTRILYATGSKLQKNATVQVMCFIQNIFNICRFCLLKYILIDISAIRKNFLRA